MRPLIIGDGIIPEAQAVYDVRDALPGRDDVVLLAHVAKFVGQEIPAGSIIYNLEPLFDGCRSLPTGYLDVLRRFTVWDYQRHNVQHLLYLHGIDALHVPYGYHASLERVPVRKKNIDVLFFGSMTARRRAILDKVRGVVTAQRLYGPELDATVARAKVVLNIHYCDGPHPLEVVRLNYLMANGCCVVSERGWDEEENARYAPGLVFSDDPVSACAEMLAADRKPFEQAARATIRAMPMVVPERGVMPCHG